VILEVFTAILQNCFTIHQLCSKHPFLFHSNHLLDSPPHPEFMLVFQSGNQNYDLTVWINGGEHHYRWSDCDTSKAGEQMTKVAETIFQVLGENKKYQEAINH
jgi:hypothetical protein